MKRAVLGIFLLALVARLLVIFSGIGFDRDLTFFDARDYDRHALNILSGKGLTNGHAWASRAPLYPLFLATLYRLFGHSHLAIRVVQSLLGASVVLLCFGIFRVYFSEKVSLGASFLYAMHPLLIVYAGNILSENLGLFLLALFLFVFLKIPNPWRGWIGGIFFGLLLLCRSPLIFFLPFVLFELGTKKKIASLLAFMVSLTLVLSPWVIRNYRLLHAFVPLTTNGGTTFWDANNPESLHPSKMGLASDWKMPGKVTKMENGRTIPLSEIEGDRYLFQRGLLFWRELFKAPVQAGYFFLRKALAAFSLHPGKSVPELLGWGILYLIFLPLGLWRSRSLGQKPTLLYGLLLQYLIASLVFFGRAKYRVVIEPYLLAFMVLGVFKKEH